MVWSADQFSSRKKNWQISKRFRFDVRQNLEKNLKIPICIARLCKWRLTKRNFKLLKNIWKNRKKKSFFILTELFKNIDFAKTLPNHFRGMSVNVIVNPPRTQFWPPCVLSGLVFCPPVIHTYFQLKVDFKRANIKILEVFFKSSTMNGQFTSQNA